MIFFLGTYIFATVQKGPWCFKLETGAYDKGNTATDGLSTTLARWASPKAKWLPQLSSCNCATDLAKANATLSVARWHLTRLWPFSRPCWKLCSQSGQWCLACQGNERGGVESQGECLVFLHVWNSSDALCYVETSSLVSGCLMTKSETNHLADALKREACFLPLGMPLFVYTANPKLSVHL